MISNPALDPRRARTLALVESPVQVLNTLEWAHHHERAGETTLLVLAPGDDTTRAQLERMLELARGAGPWTVWAEPRRGGLAPLTEAFHLRFLLADAERIVVGDPFSRYLHVLLAMTNAHDVVIVDDGTATLEFVALQRGGRALRRWHARPSARGLVLDGFQYPARRRMTPCPHHHVELFTALPTEGLPDALHTPNRYAWTRSRFPRPEVTPGVDIIGTSLVETGLVRGSDYVTGVVALARPGRERTGDGTPGRYFAHRRENPSKLGEIAKRSGLRIVRPDLPLEAHGRRGPISRTVVSFPSTVVLTLPIALGGAGVDVRLADIPRAWMTGRGTPRAQAFLDEVMASARRTHGLQTAAL